MPCQNGTLAPFKMYFRKNPCTQIDRPLLRGYKTTFAFHVSHLTGEIFSSKNYDNFHRKHMIF